jgi:hypothetical protein
LRKITDIIKKKKKRFPSRSKTEGLQEALSAFEKYCNIWKLTVNTNKSKIVVFSKNKYKTNVVFKICGQVIALHLIIISTGKRLISP